MPGQPVRHSPPPIHLGRFSEESSLGGPSPPRGRGFSSNSSPRKHATSWLRLWGVLFAIALSCLASAETLTVAAAASLTDALTTLAHRYEKSHPGTQIRLTFAGSGILQRQIEQGAPVDLFISASSKETTELVASKSVNAGDVVPLLSNRLVLIARKESKLRSWADLTSVRRLALANPATVPSGRYGQQTLEKRGLWKAIQTKLITAQNVRQALAYAASGDVDAAIVFATDAKIEPNVKIVDWAIPSKDHTPILYPAALIAASKHRASTLDLLKFLRTKESQTTFARYGFTPVARPSRSSVSRTVSVLSVASSGR